MSQRYISKAERENVILIDTLLGAVRELMIPHVDVMGKDISRRLKTGWTHMRTGMRMYIATLSNDDKVKIFNLDKQSRVRLHSKTTVLPDDEDERADVIHGLAEYAIGKECRGCVKDGETCPLRALLVAADVPYVTTDPVNCTYEMEG
jgi:hypothetical protein